MNNQERYPAGLSLEEKKKIAERRSMVVHIGKAAEKKLKNREKPTNKENILEYVLGMKKRGAFWKDFLREASETRTKELLGLISKYHKDGAEDPKKIASKEFNKKYLEITAEDPESYSYLDEIVFPTSPEEYLGD